MIIKDRERLSPSNHKCYCEYIMKYPSSLSGDILSNADINIEEAC